MRSWRSSPAHYFPGRRETYAIREADALSPSYARPKRMILQLFVVATRRRHTHISWRPLSRSVLRFTLSFLLMCKSAFEYIGCSVIFVSVRLFPFTIPLNVQIACNKVSAIKPIPDDFLYWPTRDICGMYEQTFVCGLLCYRS